MATKRNLKDRAELNAAKCARLAKEVAACQQKTNLQNVMDHLSKNPDQIAVCLHALQNGLLTSTAMADSLAEDKFCHSVVRFGDLPKYWVSACLQAIDVPEEIIKNLGKKSNGMQLKKLFGLLFSVDLGWKIPTKMKAVMSEALHARRQRLNRKWILDKELGEVSPANFFNHIGCYTFEAADHPGLKWQECEDEKVIFDVAVHYCTDKKVVMPVPITCKWHLKDNHDENIATITSADGASMVKLRCLFKELPVMENIVVLQDESAFSSRGSEAGTLTPSESAAPSTPMGKQPLAQVEGRLL
jgi:hypothetical protein